MFELLDVSTFADLSSLVRMKEKARAEESRLACSKRSRSNLDRVIWKSLCDVFVSNPERNKKKRNIKKEKEKTRASLMRSFHRKIVGRGGWTGKDFEVRS